MRAPLLLEWAVMTAVPSVAHTRVRALTSLLPRTRMAPLRPGAVHPCLIPGPAGVPVGSGCHGWPPSRWPRGAGPP